MIVEPTRHYREQKPILDRFVADPHSPNADAHEDHTDRVMRASRNKGFPVAPCGRVWP